MEFNYVMDTREMSRSQLGRDSEPSAWADVGSTTPHRPPYVMLRLRNLPF